MSSQLSARSFQLSTLSAELPAASSQLFAFNSQALSYSRGSRFGGCGWHGRAHFACTGDSRVLAELGCLPCRVYGGPAWAEKKLRTPSGGCWKGIVKASEGGKKPRQPSLGPRKVPERKKDITPQYPFCSQRPLSLPKLSIFPPKTNVRTKTKTDGHRLDRPPACIR
jgi:hypothetical protein